MERKTAITKLLFLAMLVLGIMTSTAQVVYVDPNATGTGDGASWANAVTDLQAGIDLAATVATISNPIQVWVKAGTYYPTTGTDRSARVELKSYVELYGGFAGTETTLAQRDIQNNETILSGDIGVASDNSDNSYAMFTLGSTLEGPIIIDGLKIVDTNDQSGIESQGLFNIVSGANPSSTKFSNTTIENNNSSLGSVIGFVSWPVTFEYCYFLNNGSSGVNTTLWSISSLDIINSVFVGNYAPVYVQFGSLNIVNSTFYDNSGDAVNIQDQPTAIVSTIHNNIFYQNSGNDILVNGNGSNNLTASNNLLEDPFTLGTNTISGNPQFLDAANNDLRITHCSPAVNQGDNSKISGFTVDLLGNPRIYNTDVDLGAHESQINAIFYSAVEVGDTFCNGNSDGQISVNAGGGNGGPITYSIDGTNFSANSVFTGLSAGSYPVYATDGVCVYSETFTVNEPTPVEIDVSVSPGTTATDITISATGGSGIYQYSIDGTNFQSSGTFSVSTGPITIYARDSNNCIASKTITISADGRLVLYVDPSASGSGDGGSWTNAYTDLQTAIDEAGTLASASAGVEVWVIADTYYPDVQTSTDRTKTIALKNNVHVYGGFDGSEMLRSERDFRNNLTIISGDIGVANDSTDNSYGMVTVGTDVIDEATIDGFRLQGAFSLAVEPTNGAIHLVGDVGTLNVNNCTFRYNLSNQGACIRMTEVSNTTATLNITSSGFVSNGFYATSTYIGSAIYVENNVNVYNSLFIDNKSGVGGAFYLSPDGGTLEIANSTLFDNSAGSGGAILYDASFSNSMVTLNNNIIWGNQQNSSLIPISISSSFLTANYNLFQGTLAGTGNFTANPQFFDESTYDLRIKHCSPAVDAGDNSVLPASIVTDFRGDTRLFNSIDIGAYENQITPISYTSVQVTDASCAGVSDGSIDVTATGGTGSPLEFSIDGLTYSSTSLFENLSTGDYTIFTRDTGNGCIYSEQFNIAQPDNLVLSNSSVTDITCNGDDDGTFSFTVAGGTQPYVVQITDGTNTYQSASFTSSATITDIPPGSYDVFVIDDNSCQLADVPITVNEPMSLSATATTTDIFCNGQSNGSITVTPTGGTLPYFYSLDGINFNSNNVRSNLTAGNYTVTVMDNNGCTITLNETITQPSTLSNIAISASNISCNGGSDGSFAFEGSGGTSPYEYSLDGVNFQSSPLWENLTAGTYTYIIRDVNGCLFTDSWTLTEPNALSGSVTVTGTSTCSVSDGQLDVSVSGGTTPYTYSLDGGTTTQASSTFTGLAAGSYTITVIDANNCEIAFNESVNDPVTAVVTATKTDVTCNDETDGSITVDVSGGSTPITYSLNGAVPQTSNTFSNLGAGSYSIEVVENNGCTQTVSVTISEPSALSLSTSLTDVLCNGETTGEIVANVSGGTTPYEYSLDGVNFQSSNQFTGLAAGSYNVEIRDANGCTITQNESITEPSALALSTSSITDARCESQSDGALSVTASGGVTPYQYSIDGTNYVSSPDFTGLLADNYTIIVQDANGCEAQVSETVANEFSVTATTSVSDPLCNGDANGQITLTAAGGTAPYDYYISGNANPQTSPIFDGLVAGTYILRAIDANNCQASVTVTLEEPDALTISVVQNDRKNFTVSATGGTSPYEYSIDGSTFQSSGTFSDQEPGNYTFLVMDANGCTTESDQFEVVLGVHNPEVSIYPNPASEYLEVTGVNFDQVIIYNLEGKKVKQSTIGTISVKDLAHGIHLLKIIKDGKEIHHQKLIIN